MRDDLRSSITVTNRPPSGLLRTVDVGRICSKHPEASTPVGDDAGQRLVDFVCDRCRQHSEARDPGDMGELRSRPVKRIFRQPARCDVLDHRDVLQLIILVRGRMGDGLQYLIHWSGMTRLCHSKSATPCA